MMVITDGKGGGIVVDTTDLCTLNLNSTLAHNGEHVCRYREMIPLSHLNPKAYILKCTVWILTLINEISRILCIICSNPTGGLWLAGCGGVRPGPGLRFVSWSDLTWCGIPHIEDWSAFEESVHLSWCFCVQVCLFCFVFAPRRSLTSYLRLPPQGSARNRDCFRFGLVSDHYSDQEKIVVCLTSVLLLICDCSISGHKKMHRKVSVAKLSNEKDINRREHFIIPFSKQGLWAKTVAVIC